MARGRGGDGYREDRRAQGIGWVRRPRPSCLQPGLVLLLGNRVLTRPLSSSACIIGLKIYATVPMLVVDACVNVFLTAAFIVPIARSRFPKARRLARNSCIAAVAALVTSFANFIVLSVQHGQ